MLLAVAPLAVLALFAAAKAVTYRGTWLPGDTALPNTMINLAMLVGGGVCGVPAR